MLYICCQQSHSDYLPYKVEGWHIKQTEHKEECRTEIECEKSVPFYQGKGFSVEFFAYVTWDVADATIFLCCHRNKVLELWSGYLLLYGIVDV